MLKRYQMVLEGKTGYIGLDEHAEGCWARFEDAQAALDAKLDPGIKTALCGEIRDLRDQLHALNNKLTAVTLQRDAFKRAIEEHRLGKAKNYWPCADIPT